jgi:hypothetical protein
MKYLKLYENYKSFNIVEISSDKCMFHKKNSEYVPIDTDVMVDIASKLSGMFNIAPNPLNYTQQDSPPPSTWYNFNLISDEWLGKNIVFRLNLVKCELVEGDYPVYFVKFYYGIGKGINYKIIEELYFMFEEDDFETFSEDPMILMNYLKDNYYDPTKPPIE